MYIFMKHISDHALIYIVCVFMSGNPNNPNNPNCMYVCVVAWICDPVFRGHLLRMGCENYNFGGMANFGCSWFTMYACEGNICTYSCIK